MKGKRKCFGLLLALFIMLGLSLSVSSGDSKAVSDLVYSPSANDSYSSYSPVFSNCSTWDCLSQYNYLIIDIPDNIYMAKILPIKFFNLRTTGSGRDSYFSYSQSQFIIALGDRSSSYFAINWASSDMFYVDGISFTLTDSIENCPEIEPCPVVPDYPYEDDLTNIKNAVLLVGAVPIVIYFFYAIYRMILGGVK